MSVIPERDEDQPTDRDTPVERQEERVLQDAEPPKIGAGLEADAERARLLAG